MLIFAFFVSYRFRVVSDNHRGCSISVGLKFRVLPRLGLFFFPFRKLVVKGGDRVSYVGRTCQGAQGVRTEEIKPSSNYTNTRYSD